jgi:predicted PurR-regulated permease PerM
LLLNGWVLISIFSYFQSIITKVVIALLLAFILGYAVELLQRLKVPRSRAVISVAAMALSLLIIFGITLIPTLIEQINELGARLPTWIESGGSQLQSIQSWAETRNLPVDISKLNNQLESRIATQLQTLSGEVLNVLLSALTSVVDLILTVVLTFYLLLNGDRLWNGVFRWFPAPVGPTVRQAFRQNFQNYFVGQITLALLMGTIMTIAFLVIKVPFGLLFGLGIGLLALFPFGTPLGIILVGLLTALKSIWLGLRVIAVATVIDQLIENGLAPQLIGGLTGLNPVWIIISLLVGVKIGGLIGLIIAVPLASSIKSIADTLNSSSAKTSVADDSVSKAARS